MSDGCGESCGFVLAAFAAISYGSYGVPIKATLDLDVHPLVLQSYKTIVLFMTSWFVLFLGEEAKWTPHGLLSGFLLVSGGTFGIYGIRNAGMAVAIGTWASVTVLMNFIWGMLVFREPVHSFFGASLSFLFLGLGLVGMGKYSAAPPKHIPDDGKEAELEVELVEEKAVHDRYGLTPQKRIPNFGDEEVIQLINHPEPHTDDDETEYKEKKAHTVVVGGISLTQREAGILCAVLNGILSGSSLVPMQYAKAQGFGGLSYYISFGSGALVANSSMWALIFLHAHYNRPQGTPLRATLETMPSIHLRELWFRGLMAGLLLSFGMFGALMATNILGQGVGNSLVQGKIIVSGLWGIFYFKEIKDPDLITKWFLSAGLCVSSILWLSHERSAATH
jgi:hypothetical protein